MIGSLTKRLWPGLVFVAVFVSHALYVSLVSVAPPTGWVTEPATGLEAVGILPYFRAQEYFMGFSIALGLTFSAWAGAQFIKKKRVAMAAGAVGGITLTGLLAACFCFLSGCCGSPMLAVYLSLFGPQFLHVTKPITAVLTLMSVIMGYSYLKRNQGCDCGGGPCER